MSVRHFYKDFPEVPSLVPVPSFHVGLEVSVSTGHLIVQRLPLLPQLE